MNAKNFFKVCLLTLLFTAASAAVSAQDYLILKNGIITQVFPGSAIDSVKASASQLDFYTGESAVSVPRTSIDRIRFGSNVPTIALTGLPNGKVVNAYTMADASSCEFSWEPVPAVSEYTVKISLDNTFPEGATISQNVGNLSSFQLDKATLASLVSTSGGRYYWTVVPTSAGEIAKSEVRSFTAIRMAGFNVAGFDSKISKADVSELWNGVWGTGYPGGDPASGTGWAGTIGYSSVSFEHPVSQTVEPCWFTFEVGAPVKLSEVVHHAYFPYFGSCPRRWSVYAYIGAGEPAAEEGWANWVEIGTGDNSYIPSSSAADQSARIAAYPLGDTTHIVSNAPAARYYRFKCWENRYWKDGQGGAAQPYYSFALTEIKVFAQDETDTPTPALTVAEVPHYAPLNVAGFDPAYTSDATSNPVYLWDKRWPVTYTGGSNQSWAGEAAYKNFNVGSAENEPGWFTFDIGAPLKLASYEHHFYYSFDHTCPLFWELYAYTGIGEPTAVDGWNNWIKIGEGNTDHLPAKSASDQSARIAAYPLGETLTFEKNDVPAARYYRFKCLEDWRSKNGGTAKYGGISLSEIICKAYVDYAE